MAGIFGYSREAVRVKVKKCEGNLPLEWRKFSVDPQITSLEVLYSILAKAFDLKTDFGISYKTIDQVGQDVFLAVLSDWDLDAAFLRAHNLSIATNSEPCLNLKVDIKPFSEQTEWDPQNMANSRESPSIQQSFGAGQKYVQTMHNRLPGLIMNQMEKTFSMVRSMQRALNLNEDQSLYNPPRPPLSDSEFRGYLDSVGQIVHPHELRQVIYIGGIDPSLRRVVWKHILNVYPHAMTGRERMDYMKRKAAEYYSLRDTWRTAVQQGPVSGELAYVTSMVRKDVLRTDRLHPFYAGSDDNQNIAALFNILTTYALNHPAVSYCQGMSDIASPLLVTMADEAQAYICFCAVMTRLNANFMLDGIAMTQKFQHLAESLQHYDPEFYDYLKLQQADDLLFCYRWLLLEMKREFAFEDSLRMLEVLWSSLPADPPKKELPLFEKEFQPPPSDVPAPKCPTVILRTPRENAYTKICALRRQSSALSLSLSNTSTAITIAGNTSKLDATKRLNQSLDENVNRDRLRGITKAQQSLDESKLGFMVQDGSKVSDVSSEATPDTPATMTSTPADVEDSIFKFEPEDIAEEPKIEEDELDIDEIAVMTETATELSCSAGSSITDAISHSASNSHRPVVHPTKHKNATGQSKGIFSHNTGHSITKQLNHRKGGHFKDLKDKIAASKKGIFASLDKMETIDQTDEKRFATKSQKVVKNFNEFLNFASMNKSRISDKLAASTKPDTKSEKPLIKFTASSFEDSDSMSSVADTNTEIQPKPPPPPPLLHLQLGLEKQSSFDGSSPDDSQEYFPMTTSMTRELRMELENLDRHVFGTDYQQRSSFDPHGCDTPESGDSAVGTKYANYEISYTKFSQMSIDVAEDSEISPCPNNELAAIATRSSILVQPRGKSRNDDEAYKRVSTSSANTDIFIWENPLHQFSPVGVIDEATAAATAQRSISNATPDEQTELEYDGDVVLEGDQGKRSITPIRLVRKLGSSERCKAKRTVANKRSSGLFESDSDTSDGDNQPTTMTKSDIQPIPLQTHMQCPPVATMTNSCEEASEVNIALTRVAGALPPPVEFGGGNPFLMFLSLTLLLQHRNYVMKSNMDYNEMAMHFDKMVRKHNVTRVLNQARRMYAEYLKQQKIRGAVGGEPVRKRSDVKT